MNFLNSNDKGKRILEELTNKEIRKLKKENRKISFETNVPLDYLEIFINQIIKRENYSCILFETTTSKETGDKTLKVITKTTNMTETYAYGDLIKTDKIDYVRMTLLKPKDIATWFPKRKLKQSLENNGFKIIKPKKEFSRIKNYTDNSSNQNDIYL